MRAPTSPLPIRLYTHNIRYATSSPFPGEEPWPTRLPRLLSSIRFHTSSTPNPLVFLQEVLHNQLLDLLSGLNASLPPTQPAWAYIGVGRDDGATKGEYSPIFYQPAIWSVISFRTVWLSQTPDIPSKGWDAASIRIVTVGAFKHRESGREVVALSTHLDDQGEVSRYESARVLREIVEEEGLDVEGRITRPVVLAGDFNSEVDGRAYGVLSADVSPVVDVKSFLKEGGGIMYGHENTFTGFQDEDLKRIDFLWVGPKKGEGWKGSAYAVLDNQFDDGVYLSDHRPVVGDLVLA
ncbi:hypothetical protein M501DRAFT_942694 [Patellaria atrata CBS 101060]|uniref:Endonuclease/exonuclease/phosphatase domain-containing protein n=1 Tax=Patellaria atrata CBS 101060 TaxID=1346257 RepID=A0A9P4S450_9PEZI|nr:hypothetical protein M501DRAFT_942694 [Patellaria atrata CBS 101060]